MAPNLPPHRPSPPLESGEAPALCHLAWRNPQRHFLPAPVMHPSEQILRILDDALGLQGRAQSFDRNTALLGALPELDSMAVLALITGLENHFGITFEDDDLNGSVFATVGSLNDMIEQVLASQSP